MQRTKRGTATAMAAVLLFSSAAPYCEASRTSQARPADVQPPDSTLAGKNSKAYPTAEDLLHELRAKRPVREVIQPVSDAGRTGRQDGRALVPEGTLVVDRVGRLSADGPDWVFVSESQTTDGSADIERTRLLSCSSLEVMVRTARGSIAPVTFVVSGEMTVFQDRNHLLIRHVRRLDRGTPAFRARPTEPREPGSPEGGLPSNERASEDRSTVEPVEDVLSALRGARPLEQPLPAEPSPARAPRDRAALATVTLIPEGTPLVRRPGRLVLEGLSWVFAFESDTAEAPERPIKVLPNLNTELMAQAADSGGAGQVFVVSGEVTLFEGQNYLLPRVAMRRINAGNFRK